MDGRTDVRSNRSMDEWRAGGTDGRMEGRMDGSVDGWINALVIDHPTDGRRN